MFENDEDQGQEQAPVVTGNPFVDAAIAGLVAMAKPSMPGAAQGGGQPQQSWGNTNGGMDDPRGYGPVYDEPRYASDTNGDAFRGDGDYGPYGSSVGGSYGEDRRQTSPWDYIGGLFEPGVAEAAELNAPWPTRTPYPSRGSGSRGNDGVWRSDDGRTYEEIQAGKTPTAQARAAERAATATAWDQINDNRTATAEAKQAGRQATQTAWDQVNAERTATATAKDATRTANEAVWDQRNATATARANPTAIPTATPTGTPTPVVRPGEFPGAQVVQHGMSNGSVVDAIGRFIFGDANVDAFNQGGLGGFTGNALTGGPLGAAIGTPAGQAWMNGGKMPDGLPSTEGLSPSQQAALAAEGARLPAPEAPPSFSFDPNRATALSTVLNDPRSELGNGQTLTPAQLDAIGRAVKGQPQTTPAPRQQAPAPAAAPTTAPRPGTPPRANNAPQTTARATEAPTQPAQAPRQQDFETVTLPDGRKAVVVNEQGQPVVRTGQGTAQAPVQQRPVQAELPPKPRIKNIDILDKAGQDEAINFMIDTADRDQNGAPIFDYGLEQTIKRYWGEETLNKIAGQGGLIRNSRGGYGYTPDGQPYKASTSNAPPATFDDFNGTDTWRPPVSKYMQAVQERAKAPPPAEAPRGERGSQGAGTPQRPTEGPTGGTNPLVDDPRGYGPAYSPGPAVPPAAPAPPSNALVDDPRGYGVAYQGNPGGGDLAAGTRLGDRPANIRPGVEQWRPQVEAAFRDLGPSAVDNVLAIMQMESGGNPNAFNGGTAKYGPEHSTGLMQINRDAWPHLYSRYDMRDPAQNLLAAREVWNQQGPGAWYIAAKNLGLI